MSVYMTEEEQIENIKAWWMRHQKWISMLISIALLAFAGYRFYMWRSDKITQQASTQYEQLMRATAAQDEKQIEAYAKHIIQSYPNTVYRDAAVLALAKHWIKEKNFDEAKASLESVAAKAQMPALKEVAKLRLVRIWLSEGQYEKALTTLDKMDTTLYKPLALELKGDAYLKMGKSEEAVTAYREAHEWVKLHGLHSGFLDMKLSQVG